MRRPLTLASALFFASGAAALVFESLWFRRAGLAFGNSVWASALVLSSFMTGLALGNALGGRMAARLAAPLRAYALLEIGVAAAGIAIVAGLPQLGPALAPVFSDLLPSPWLLQPLRFAASFVVMLGPAIAMGATLPVLVHALRERDADFGRLLGRLYGWNTLGAMAGAISVELVWIPIGGIYGAAAVAGLLNAGAALAAIGLESVLASAGRGEPARHAEGPAPPARPLGSEGLRMLLAAGLAGATALAFEVVWFRILVQFLPNSSAMFAAMLASVLAGIAIGSLLAAALFRDWPRAHEHASSLAFFTTALAVLSFACVPAVIDPLFAQIQAEGVVVGGSIRLGRVDALLLFGLLMLPVSIASGCLFAWLGKRIEDVIRAPARTAGLLALANTAGAAVAPLVAGFVLLPELGMERSSWWLAIGYVGVGLLAWPSGARGASTRLPAMAGALAAGLALIAFPTGALERTLYGIVEAQWGKDEKIIALREGVVETAIVTRQEWGGETLAHRLVTDGYSMSGTQLAGRRYMRLFVHLPAALHPRLESALLISFGVGTTADALRDLAELERIDVVDISPEILELASTIWPEPGTNPLEDARFRVHIEDGRYFLQTTGAHYDLITAEPPPPAFAGVVNLYTEEYFRLIHARLRSGGFATYWLPVSQMRAAGAKAIVAAFCGAFRDCSLWESFAGDWMLMGSRQASGPVPDARARAQWDDPALAQELSDIGFEVPEQLGAIFLADAPFLAEWVGDVRPLVDSHPERAPAVVPTWIAVPEAFRFSLDASANRERFAGSPTIARLWPAALLGQTLEHFLLQPITRVALLDPARAIDARLADLHRILERTRLETLPLWILGSGSVRQRAAAARAAGGDRSAEVERELGIGALARRRFDAAARHFASAAQPGRASDEAVLQVYALAMANRSSEAARAAADARLPETNEYRTSWRMLKATFALAEPSSR